MKSIFVIFLLLVNLAYSKQKIALPGTEPPVEFSFETKSLVFEEDSNNLNKNEILSLFEDYKSCLTRGDVTKLLGLFVPNDAYLEVLKKEESRRKWVEISSRVISVEILGYLLDESTSVPTDVIYIVEKQGAGKSVNLLSTKRINGVLKIKSNKIASDSAQYAMQVWWANNYPKKPTITTLPDTGNKPSRLVDFIIYTGVTITLAICAYLAAKALRKRS